jgi:hypothetical protein
MQIKQAKQCDVPGLVAVAGTAYERATGKKDFRVDVSAGNWMVLVGNETGTIFYVADNSGPPQGLICGYKTQNIDTGKTVAIMWHWFVESPAKGYGVQLLWKFQRWAKEKHCQQIQIGCLNEFWDKSHEALYKKLGYKCHGLNFVKEL